ncbi:MAG: polymer-forming cytoskeletal protein [Anditalea sp.]
MKEDTSLANSISVFAEGLKLEGNIEAINDVRVDGIILGNISSKRKVMVGGTGKIIGNIDANEVCVMGEITGDLHVKGLAKIGSTGKLKGNIVSEKIQIEEGADVEATLTKVGSSQKEERDNSFGKMKELELNKSKPSPMEKVK